MRNKIMNYFKGKNPYLLASFVIVMVTVGIMFVILQNTEPVGNSDEVVSTEQISVIGKESIEVYVESSTEVETPPVNEAVLEQESADIDEADENSTEIKTTETEAESMPSEMTAKEKAAFSMGYVKHARDTARAYKFNLALDLGASKKDAQNIANNPNIHFNDKMGCFVQRKK